MNKSQEDTGDAQRLTTKKRWRYSRQTATRKNINAIKEREEWLAVFQRFVPELEIDYLELGCAPGQYTAALSESKPWRISGIDYSEDAELFKETLAIVGKDATLHRIDMFHQQIDQRFDVVTSIGLVEHFRGSMLDQVFGLHDLYAKPGGTVMIMVPNFTGFNYVWHYLFDRPDLDRHNVDVMQPAVFDWFSHRGYEILFNDYIGVMRLWGNSGWTRYRFVGRAVAGVAVVLSKVARGLHRIGLSLSGRTWSPSLIFVARKPKEPN